MISKHTLDAVKNQPDMVAVMSTYMVLKRRGKHYLGLCPFHSEKSPSFTVSPERRLWHCFGCKESGDLIAFVMKMDTLTFTDAVRHIAQLSGIEVEEDETNHAPELKQAEKERKRLWELMALAKNQCHDWLKGSPAENYCSTRQLSESTLTTFKVGYTPQNSELLDWAKAKGFSTDDLLRSGLCLQTPEGALVSRFRGRLMFPILDIQGRTVGFGGRRLHDDSQTAKYVNTDETPLFNKRKLLYGIEHAKQGIRQQKSAILMEGYMDVITAHQFGFNQTVGSMGTALTTDQVALLRRLTDKVYLAFDSDLAGQESTWRSYDLLKQQGFSVFVVVLDEKDPAESLLKHGASYFQSLLDNAPSMMEAMLEKQFKAWDKTNIEQLPKLLEPLIGLLQKESDPVVREAYLKHIALKFNIQPENLLAKINKNRYNAPQQKIQPQKDKKSKVHKAEELLIFFAATRLDLRSAVVNGLEGHPFLSPDLELLFDQIKATQAVDEKLIECIAQEPLKSELTRILVEHEDHYTQGQSEKLCQDCILAVKRHALDFKVETLKSQLKELEKQGNDDDINAVLNELQKLLKTETSTQNDLAL